jgi:hypothetical protein
MTRISVCLLLPACALVFACMPLHAQAGGEALGRQAQQLKSSFLTGTADQMYSAFAPWLRGRADLAREALDKELEDADEEEALGFLAHLDPNSELGAESLDDIRKFTAAEMNALFLRVYILRADKDVKDNLAARWHLIERKVYQRDDGLGLSVHGDVIFMNVHGDRIDIYAEAQGNEWHITRLAYKIGDHDGDTEESLMGIWEDVLQGPEASAAEAVRSEAEQLAGSMRNYLRVQWARTGEAPETLTEADAADFAQGHYFTIEDKVHALPDDRGAVIAVPNEDESLGVLLLVFSYPLGETEMLWFDTREELDRHLAALNPPQAE